MNRFITAYTENADCCPTALPNCAAAHGREPRAGASHSEVRHDRQDDLAQAASRRHCNKAGEDPHGRAQPWRAPDDVEFRPSRQRAKCEHGTGAGPP